MAPAQKPPIRITDEMQDAFTEGMLGDLDKMEAHVKDHVKERTRGRRRTDQEEWTWRQAIQRIPNGLKAPIITALLMVVVMMAKFIWDTKKDDDSRQWAAIAEIRGDVDAVKRAVAVIPDMKDVGEENRKLLWQVMQELNYQGRRQARLRRDSEEEERYTTKIEAAKSRQNAIAAENKTAEEKGRRQ